MVLTQGQISEFFVTQMQLPAETVTKLEDEGILHPTDLKEFDKEAMARIDGNLRKPGDRIPNPDPGAQAGSTIPRPPYILSAKSQKRLLEAGELMRFYDAIGRDLTNTNIVFDTVIADFTDQWKALVGKKKETSQEVPKISKELPILKWFESMEDFLSQVVGIRTIPLSYVIRAIVDVPAAVPEQQPNKPHSRDHGSVEADLVARASHTHANYRNDNEKVYYLLEEATRTTPYAASLKSYQRKKDGRGAWNSLRATYAGRDKWDGELKKQQEMIQSRTWKGQNNYPLEKFIAAHRNAYVSMEQCSQHVPFQLPNAYTRVGDLLKNIESSDPGLQAAIANINQDEGGKRVDFEAAAAFLLPYDPVAKKRQAGTKRDLDASIGGTTGETNSSFGKKPGIGKTGVHFRYHEDPEFAKLTKEQRDELKAWRAANQDKVEAEKKAYKQKKKGFGEKKGFGARKKVSHKAKKKMVSAISKEVAKQMKSSEDEDEVFSSVMSLLTKPKPEPPTKKQKVSEPSTVEVSTSALKSIMKKVRNPEISSITGRHAQVNIKFEGSVDDSYRKAATAEEASKYAHVKVKLEDLDDDEDLTRPTKHPGENLDDYFFSDDEYEILTAEV